MKCKYCKNNFIPKHGNQLYCSKHCMLANKPKPKPKLKQHLCLGCGDIFESFTFYRSKCPNCLKKARVNNMLTARIQNSYDSKIRVAKVGLNNEQLDVYESISEAAKLNNLKETGISRAIKRGHRSGGYRWEKILTTDIPTIHSPICNDWREYFDGR